VNQLLWKEKNAPNFLPVSVFEPFGTPIIQRLLDSGTSAAAPVPRQAPPASSSGDAQAVDLLRGGHQSREFRWLVGRLFDQNQVEYAVGMSLARHPLPSRQEIDQFTRNLPENMVDDIEENGWNILTLAVDRVVMDAIRDPGVQAEMKRALNASPAGVMALVDGVRRIVLCRASRIILNSGERRMAGQAA